LGFFTSLCCFDSASHFAKCDVIVTLSSDSTAFRFAFCPGCRGDTPSRNTHVFAPLDKQLTEDYSSRR